MVALVTITIIALSACTGTDQRVQKLAQDAYSRSEKPQPMPPREFASDGCSLWPDNGWLECCVEHDLVYWVGGSSEQRYEADRILKECVKGKGYSTTGALMYFGVRVGGTYWLPTPFRWGFGWDYPQSGPPGMEY